MEAVLILVLAFLLDMALGEPPGVIHPVIYMGKWIRLLESFFLRWGKLIQFIGGVFTSIAVLVIFTLPLYFILKYIRYLNHAFYILISAFVLKTTFSVKALKDSARLVKGSLLNNDLTLAQEQLKSLVSRETYKLDERLIISATIESLGENTTDSIVSPWLFFVFLGVPGAMAFRALNTLDAMIGYHGKYEYFGKFAARLDDIANFIPARVAGLLICIGAFFIKRSFLPSFFTMLSGARKTVSPNAGFTIGAIAGALGVELEKKDHYRIGKGEKPLDMTTIEDGIKVLEATVIFTLFLCIGLFFLKDKILHG